MEVREHYPNPNDAEGHSGNLSRPRAGYWDQVEALRASGDIAMFLSVPDSSGDNFRLTLANGESIQIDRKALRWFIRNELTGENEPRTALVHLIARRIFRARGGKKALGMSFREWLLAW